MSINTMSIAPTKPYDVQSLGILYDQHSSGIFRYATRLLGNQDLAEECVSETFSRFLHALKKGHGPAENVQAYLYRVAHNWITDHYRNNRNTVSLEIEEQEDSEQGPSQVVSRSLLRDRVRTALLSLPYEQQRVIELRFLDNLSHEEAAQALGRSVEATRALQYRALKSLREMLYEAEE